MPFESSEGYYRQTNGRIHNEMKDDDDDDDYFHPLVYCTIIMDENADYNGTRATSSSCKYQNNEQLKYKSDNISLRSVVLSERDDKEIRLKDISLHSNYDGNVSVNVIDGNNNNNNKILKKKKYTCQFCNKIFGWSTDLKRHILIHTGERPFKCSLCSASFTRNFLLQKHKTKIHQTPLQLSILDENVAENLKEIKMKMLELENVKNQQL